jgi:hypothetical protein
MMAMTRTTKSTTTERRATRAANAARVAVPGTS